VISKFELLHVRQPLTKSSQANADFYPGLISVPSFFGQSLSSFLSICVTLVLTLVI
jgi:hypothetical protein